jgi:hypothetical protein
MAIVINGSGSITGISAGGLPDGSVTADDLASGAAVSNIGYTPANQSNVMGRNRIINGDMRIDQRNAGASVTLGSGYAVDRWLSEEDTDGAATAQQVSDAPVGFVNSIKWTTTTADASLGATQYATIRQHIEGNNIADLGPSLCLSGFVVH